jgi:hypothetical protein
MQKRLPVEMRNIIYHHLWDKATITTFPDLSRVAGGSKCLKIHCTCARSHEVPRLPHFVKPEFMGRDTAREIVRALYDAFHTRDEPLTIRAPEHIKLVISKDVFQLDLDPGLHLRSLVLRIKLDRLRLPRTHHALQHKLSSTCQHTDAEKIYTKGPELRAWLKELKRIEYKDKFELRISLFQRNFRVAVMEEVLLQLTHIRRYLQARKMEVTIDWEYRGNWEKGIESDAEYDLCHDMDNFYTLPRNEWRLFFMDTLLLVG